MCCAQKYRILFERKHLRVEALRLPGFEKRLVSHLLTLGLMGSLLLMTEKPARAYVDPGSGFLAVQLIGAWLTGIFFILRHKLKALAGRTADRFQDAASKAILHSQEGEPEATRAGQAGI